MRRKREQFNFSDLLNNKRIPIVILDERWHHLFEKLTKTSRIAELEKKLGDLMKQQGKFVTDVKSLKAAKQRLMEGIVANMNVDSSTQGKLNDRKLFKSQKLIQDINGKLKDTDNNLADIPYKIKSTNEQLVVAGMQVCYQTLSDNSEEISDIDQRVTLMREEIKNLLIKKQEMEAQNNDIYSYMHSVLGSEVMEIFDQYYSKHK